MLTALVLTGCALAPTSVLTEVEHVSHPGAGWPVSDRYDEDGLTQANVLAHWQDGDWYAEAGLGVNLRGAGGGGFYGPAVTATFRAGREWKIAR